MADFEKATRLKLRFASSQGNVSIEDLWGLKLPELDRIAQALNKQLKASKEEVFFATKEAQTAQLQLAFDLVLHVGNTLKQEQEALKSKVENAAKKQRLLAIVEEKRNEADQAKTVEELLAEIEKM